MTRPLPSKAERMVRAVVLLATSLALTLLARALGFYNDPRNTTMVALTILAIIIIAVLVSRLCTKPIMRLFGWNP